MIEDGWRMQFYALICKLVMYRPLQKNLSKWKQYRPDFYTHKHFGKPYSCLYDLKELSVNAMHFLFQKHGPREARWPFVCIETCALIR